jgi:hypothetical protein
VGPRLLRPAGAAHPARVVSPFRPVGTTRVGGDLPRANAIGLLVANALLDDMSVDGSAFVIAVLIFTGIEVLVQQLITQIAIKNANALVGSSALIATPIGLIVTVTR